MSFGWLVFLSSRGIPFTTSGPNVPRGDLCAIKCPWCGRSDPSEHLAISNNGFHCWRNRSHKGGNPAKLVQALIHCTLEQANEITGRNSIHVPDDFLSMIKRNLTNDPPPKPRHELTLPKDFRPFRHLPSARPFINYLNTRGFKLSDIEGYDLRYCVNGPFKGRIIFPVVFEGKLVSWTGRSISPRAGIRYKSLTTDPEQAAENGLLPAVGSINHYLLWFDSLMKTSCRTIVLCEGPFDSLKVNVLGRDYSICSTCFFTSSPSTQQVNLLHELLPRFKRRVLLLDQETLPTALKVSGQLNDLGIEIGRLPEGTKDPGTISTTNELLKILA